MRLRSAAYGLAPTRKELSSITSPTAVRPCPTMINFQPGRRSPAGMGILFHYRGRDSSPATLYRLCTRRGSGREWNEHEIGTGQARDGTEFVCQNIARSVRSGLVGARSGHDAKGPDDGTGHERPDRVAMCGGFD